MHLFSEILSIVLPVFAVIALGALLKRLGLIDGQFLQQTNRLVYYVCLPLLLFYEIRRADFLANFNGPLVCGSILAVTITFLISYLYTVVRRYPPAARGVFSQGAFRGNIAYVGLAIVFNALGQSGLTRAGILMGFLVPLLHVGIELIKKNRKELREILSILADESLEILNERKTLERGAQLYKKINSEINWTYKRDKI